MSVFRKYLVPTLFLLLISVLYFGLRLPNLTSQPIFADEAIYIRWAQVMRAEPTLRFLPMSDGKTPLFMWILIPVFHFFSDPLYAGRLLSIISGYVTLLGVVFLGWKWFTSRSGLLSGFLVAITPFLVFFDRMALVDSMLAAFSIWTLNLALLLIKYPRLDLAMFLGYIMGAGILVKPPGLYSLITLPVTGLLFNWRQKNGREFRLIKLVGLWIVALIIAYGIFNILRLGPGFSSLTSRNQDYVFSISELKDRPLDPFLPHINDLSSFLTKLLTWPLLILSLVGVVWIIWKRNLTMSVVFLWGLIPLLAEMIFLKTFTARYILFFIPPLILISAVGIEELISNFKFQISNSLIAIIIISAISPWALYMDYQLVYKPETANLPRVERNGYFENWTAGYGLKETAEYLMKKAETGPVIIGTEGYFGTLPDGLQIYLDKYNHSVSKDHTISVIGGKAETINLLRSEAKKNQTYFLVNRGIKDAEPSNVEKVLVFPKIISPEFPQGVMILYKVLPTLK